MLNYAAGVLLAATVAISSAAAQLTYEGSGAHSGVRPSGESDVEPTCDYDRCALRLTLNFGTWRIVRGIDETTVGSFGLLSAPKLSSLVSEVPAAAKMASHFRSRYTRSRALIWGGAGVAFLGSVVAMNNSAHAPGLAVGVVGLAAMIVGGRDFGRTIDILSKSIWLYNRELPRSQ